MDTFERDLHAIGVPAIDQFLDPFRRLLAGLDIDRLIGKEVLDQGFKDIASGLLPIFGELVAADLRDDALSSAVANEDKYPHLHRFHCHLRSVFLLEVPAEVLKYARRAVASVSRKPRALEKLGATMLPGSNRPGAMLLLKYAIFEGACAQQWITAAEFMAAEYPGEYAPNFAHTETMAQLELTKLTRDGLFTEKWIDYTSRAGVLLSSDLKHLRSSICEMINELQPAEGNA